MRWRVRVVGRPRIAKAAAVSLIAILPLLATAPTNAHGSQPVDDPSTAAIDRFVERWMAANGIPGLALAITRGQRVIHLQGYGDAGPGRPVTPDTRFLVASLSKSFTAMAVMQLVEDGQIDLDASIRRYLPRFTVAEPAGADKITVRMLLNQTSGLADAGYPEMTLPQPRTIAGRVASLGDARLVSEPGTAFHYFNPNYAVLARLVEVVSGQPFRQYLREHVFGPLRMTETTSVVTSAEVPSVAPHLAQGHIQAFGVPIVRDEQTGYLGGSGGVISTAEDMGNWLIAQNEGGAFRGRSLISPRGIALMHTPPRGVDSSYAMGWMREPGSPSVVKHTGVLSTFYAEQALVPGERYGIVFLANVYNGMIDFEGLMRGLTEVVTHDQRPAVGFGAQRIGLVVGALTVVIAAFGVWRLLRARPWAESRRGKPWRSAVGVVVPFLTTALVLVMPSLVARFSDRVFGWRLLFLAVPDVMVCLAFAAAVGAALGITRVVFLARRART